MSRTRTLLAALRWWLLQLLGVLAFSACSEGPSSPEGAKPAAPPGTVLSGPPQSLRLHGSNTIGISIAPILAKGFLQKAGATNISVNSDDRKGQRIWVQGVLDGRWTSVEIFAPGSKVAFASLAAGECDIGLASREVTESEASTLRSLGDMTNPTNDHVMALDAIAIIVHPNNRVQKLSTDALAAIFSGEITDWSELPGGAHEPIHLYTRDNNSGTHDAFTSIVMRGKSVRPDSKTFEDSEALSAAVSQDSGGIGYVGLPFIKAAKAVAIQDGDGSALFPTVFTVATEDYALSRRLHLYTAGEPKNPLVRPFLDYVMSEEGQKLVEEAGFVSLAVKAESPIFPPGTPPAYQAEVKSAYRLSVDFRFRTGSSELDTKALPDLDRVIKYLSLPDNRQRHVMLHGFADSKGQDKVNAELSKTRAEVVAKELRRRGIQLEKSLGWGSALPVATNETPEGRERNRRVEIWIR